MLCSNLNNINDTNYFVYLNSFFHIRLLCYSYIYKNICVHYAIQFNSKTY